MPKSTCLHFQKEDELENEQLNENANELLREVVRYGLDQSQFISEVEERELYDEGIRSVYSVF